MLAREVSWSISRWEVRQNSSTQFGPYPPPPSPAAAAKFKTTAETWRELGAAAPHSRYSFTSCNARPARALAGSWLFRIVCILDCRQHPHAFFDSTGVDRPSVAVHLPTARRFDHRWIRRSLARPPASTGVDPLLGNDWRRRWRL